MTPEQLDAIQARADAATEGPWEHMAFDSGHSKFEMNHYVIKHDTGDCICDMDGLYRSGNEKYATDDGGADATFIAHARADVPALLAYARDLEARLGRVEALADDACAQPGTELAPVKAMGGFIRAALTATEARA